MIRFRCFVCNAKLEIEDKHVGRKGRCPTCKTKNTVPSPNDTLEDSIMKLFKDLDDLEEEKDIGDDDKDYELI